MDITLTNMNVDPEVYGKFFSLYLNDFQAERDAAMRLFDVYTFTNGYTDDLFQFSIIGLQGSIARLLAIPAIQLSQIRDTARWIHFSKLIENKTGLGLLRSAEEILPDYPADIGEEKMRDLMELMFKRKKPKMEDLKDFLAALYGVNKKYFAIGERESQAAVDVPIVYPRPTGIIASSGFNSFIERVTNKFKSAGITYIYVEILTAITTTHVHTSVTIV